MLSISGQVCATTWTMGAIKGVGEAEGDGSIFEKYSGKKTPGQCSTEDFMVFQMRMLKAARAMLMTLWFPDLGSVADYFS